MKTINLKKACMCLLAGSLLTSCASNYDAIGKVGMLAPQRVEKGVKYSQLSTNSGNIKASTAQTVTQAVQQVVDKVPGGRYMTDVTVYVVNGGYVAVTGNVWGVGTDSIPHASPAYNGYFTMKALDREKNVNKSKAVALK